MDSVGQGEGEDAASTSQVCEADLEDGLLASQQRGGVHGLQVAGGSAAYQDLMGETSQGHAINEITVLNRGR